MKRRSIDYTERQEDRRVAAIGCAKCGRPVSQCQYVYVNAANDIRCRRCLPDGAEGDAYRTVSIGFGQLSGG